MNNTSLNGQFARISSSVSMLDGRFSEARSHLGNESESSRFEVRLALPHELDEVFALRWDVFLSGNEQIIQTMKDVDDFDAVADHLVVIHQGRIVATYRVLPTDRVLNAGLGLYAAHEFVVEPLMEMLDPRKTVELGRSCVHPAYRNGAIPKLLWSALAKYMTEQGRSEAVGCVSVFNRSHAEANALVKYFQNTGAWTAGFECPASTKVESVSENFDAAHLKSLVPPLLRSYLMLGAKILGGPAHDPVFHCHDFLMHFSTTTMSERCRKTLFS
jgi:putative hemolysin